MQCLMCSLLSCAPGFYSSGCARGAIRDAMCLPCTTGPTSGPFSWTSGCGFVCQPGFWLDGRVCRACSVLNCTAGTYASQCGSADSACVPCPGPPLAVWTGGCNFTCPDAYFLDGAACSPLVTPAPIVMYPASAFDYGPELMSSVGAAGVGGVIVMAVYSKMVAAPLIGPLMFGRRFFARR